ncbi:MAG TPA: PaaI family thioesterase [Polyangia bacterium]|nr:PaaI family thioesterase [Polyangia bacterium]
MPEEMYDVLQRAMKDVSDLPAPPIARLLGFKLEAISPGRATMVLDADERLANPMGTLHGGVLCDIADAAMGMAYASELARGETFTTLELKINFMKPVWRARLRAEGKVVKRGRTVGLVEADVFDDKGSLVARASSTCMTLRGDSAQGR